MGRGSFAVASSVHRLANQTTAARAPRRDSLTGSRCTQRTYTVPDRANGVSHQAARNGNGNSARAREERESERDFFLSVLSASTTKRDAKSYLSRFNSPTAAAPNPQSSKDNVSSPQHIALVKIRALHSLDGGIVEGVSRTISQLSRLGLVCVIVVDSCSDELDGPVLDAQEKRKQTLVQSDKLVSFLDKRKGVKVCRLDNTLGVTPIFNEVTPTAPVRGSVEVQYRDLLLGPIRRGIIPVIPPIGYTTETQTLVDLDANEVVLALTRQFAGLQTQKLIQGKPHDDQLSRRPVDDLVVDRIILLDPLGGVPSITRPDKAHIFVNLEQEYDDIRNELRGPCSTALRVPKGGNKPVSWRPNSEPERIQHTRNLDLLQHSLALLPPSSSALITTPHEAATLPQGQSEADLTPATTDLGVQTRRPKNPLIYSLLTDKPVISSSLPVARLSPFSEEGDPLIIQSSPATFVKRGMTLTLIPDPRVVVWHPPLPSETPLAMDDPRIDFPRLLNLIEDSFNRPLDVEHYLSRVRHKIAGIIIAGEYEGGAILTWELPPGVPDDGSEASRARMVPYLDKFAVLKRSQGAGGVADIVFSAMVRTCFPKGVCWRSRKNNPVNKWYFERSVGSLKLPETEWTMFWTTEGLMHDEGRWRDYEAVCRAVQPSWADRKHVVD